MTTTMSLMMAVGAIRQADIANVAYTNSEEDFGKLTVVSTLTHIHSQVYVRICR